MIDEILGWTAVAASVAGTGALLWTAWTWPRGARCRCPGPRCRRRDAANPLRWFRRDGCWYDLRGQTRDDAGFVRCPECGRNSEADHLLVDGRRLRPGPMATVALVLAAAAFAVPWIRSGSWTRSVPTLPLVAVSSFSHAAQRSALKEELSQRLGRGEVNGLSGKLLVETLVDDLRDDDDRWNAERAASMLNTLWPRSEPALEAELASGGPQSRHFAARILRNRSISPSPALLRSCVDELRDDAGELRPYLAQGSARVAARYLGFWIDLAEPFLAEAMTRGDPQQRLLAAGIAGNAGRSRLQTQAVPILVGHLRDNGMRGDAKVAAPALYRFGPDVLPLLRAHADIDDDQARRIVLSIIERLEHPERPLRELEHPLPRITRVRADPLRDLSLESAISYLHP